MAYTFWPVKAFEWVDNGKTIAAYTPGLSYTVHSHNTKLDAKVQEWAAAGLVIRVIPEPVTPKKPQSFLSKLLFGKEE